MKKLLSLSMLLIAALLIGAACQSASTANIAGNNTNKAANNSAAPKTDEHAQQDDAPRISLADAKKDFDAGKAIFIDTRAAESFNLEHIKGAVNVPAGEFETRYATIPKDKKIIAYCS